MHRFKQQDETGGLGALFLSGATGLMLVCAMLLGCPHAAHAAGLSAGITGIVRDAQGVAQMGALVQVLTPDSSTVATAFTDQRGHYSIANILPGIYRVTASAALFVPATRANLQLRTGARAVVNLTLATLFDTTSWLPAERRGAQEPADDWRWTLRSSANRPILRVLDDGTPGGAEAPQSKAPAMRLAVAGGEGGFGASGVHTTVSSNQTLRNGSNVLLRADVAGTGSSASTEVAAGTQRAVGLGGSQRSMVSYRSHPEVTGPDGSRGLQVLEVAGAQQTNLGDLLELEFGGRLRGVVAGASSAVQSSPFLRLTARPTGAWTIRYRMATSQDLQSVDDLTPHDDLPAAAVSAGRLLLEKGRHQGIAITRQAGKGVIELTVYHDSLDRVALGGGLGHAAQAPVSLPGGLTDPASGSFRALTSGYRGDGVEMLVSSPLPSGMRATVQYSMGPALGSAAASAVPGAPALTPHLSQAATVALKGRIKGSGTSLRTVYRWQPGKMVTAVNPFGAYSDQGYLSVAVRQPVRWGDRLPTGLEATIDVTNLLAQGYRPFLSADGQTLYFAQAPRTMQAGLSFSF